MATDLMGIRDRPMRERFSRMARRSSHVAGTPWAFAFALGLIAAWIVTGPIFGFSDTWQLVINTTTTIVTFLMVFLIQNTQNKDTSAIHVKLNELIASQPGASNHLIDLEDLTDADIERLHRAFQKLADVADEKEVSGRLTVEAIEHEIEQAHLARGEHDRHARGRRA